MKLNNEYGIHICPICGNIKNVDYEIDDYVMPFCDSHIIFCGDCGATATGRNEDEAVRNWNNGKVEVEED